MPRAVPVQASELLPVDEIGLLVLSVQHVGEWTRLTVRDLTGRQYVLEMPPLARVDRFDA